jgi:endonuclease G
MAAAKRAADMTCSYRNAIPQVPALNRAVFGYHGLWGQLEGRLLEAGVENESGKSARICVFAGPLFASDDPVFKSVQVAVNCFKVVVWYDGSGVLRTRASVFRRRSWSAKSNLRCCDSTMYSRHNQCPIGEIEAATGLKFHDTIRDSDTSTGEAEIVNEVLFERLLRTEGKPES